MSKKKLNKKDWKILAALDRNARRTDAAIGREVGLSREVVAYRINKLQEQGIIKEFITILNAPALGLLTFRVHFKFRSLTKQREEEIKNTLLRGAFWLVKVRGYWSFNTIFQTKNYHRLQHFLNEIKLSYGDFLEDYKVDIVTKIYHFQRKYLSNSTEKTVHIWGSRPNTIELDELDKQLLCTIENNARLSTIQIANICNVSERVIRYRLKRLIERKVILGFRSSLDIGKLGYMYLKVQMKLQRMDKHTWKRIRAYAAQHPNVVFDTEGIGTPDFEPEFQVTSMGELYKHIDEFREEFNEHLVDWMWLEYVEEAKLSYLFEL